MPGNIQPLNQWMRIANDDGTPTPEFIRWAQERQIDITDAIDAAEAQALIDAWAAARDIVAGVGLSGGGNLSADITINLEDTAVTPGAYTNTNLTVDAQGRITAAANGSSGVADGDKGDITVSSSGTVWTIDNGVVSNTKLASVATGTFKGRITAGSGAPEDLTGTQATTLLNVFTSSLKGLAPASGGGTTNYLRADGSWASPPGAGVSDGDKGDISVTSSGTVWTIDNGVVSLVKMSNLAANSIIGNNTGGSATPLALTVAQVTAMLNQFTSSLQGLVPASGGGTTNFLRADGAFASIPYSFGFFFTYTPAASEILLIHTAAEAFTLPANFSTPTSRGTIGTNPTSSFVIDVKQNGVSIGSITISTSGVFTFTTTSGTAKAIAAGDVLTFIAPSSADATAANCGITIRGTR